ncbi:hypothetical protein [Streptomyces sp. NPDC051572]|uniref:hypothetical protein n=1 Tax=Streptomyces sp. NPDC051572 TaxID=3155802 RepID=UPI00344FA369
MFDQLFLKDRQLPGLVHLVGPGWVPLLARLHLQLSVLAADYQVEKIASRFGRLELELADRFDNEGEFDGQFADVSSALSEAAVLTSQQICEMCGADGRPRMRGEGRGTFIRTLCDRCRVATTTGLPGVSPQTS